MQRFFATFNITKVSIVFDVTYKWENWSIFWSYEVDEEDPILPHNECDGSD